ncbi:hypothetical protein HDV05_000461, partial [Chytridiales sp. JEL 0842]
MKKLVYQHQQAASQIAIDALNAKADTIIAEVKHLQDLVHKSPSNQCENVITLSVQGSVFVLTLDFVLSVDWIVAKIVTSDVPFTSVNGQVYLDVDPLCFRIIVSVLQGITDLHTVVSKSSDPELTLLTSTAEYLLCLDIANQLGSIQCLNKQTMAIGEEWKPKL